jgi:hypothetical protein
VIRFIFVLFLRPTKTCSPTNDDTQSIGQTQLTHAATIGTDNLNCKKILSSAEEKKNQLEKPAISVVTEVASKSSKENIARKVLIVLPSHGEPCEGANSDGSNCNYGSEQYLINSEGQKSAWCQKHLKKILTAYDTTNYTVQYGLKGNDNG